MQLEQSLRLAREDARVEAAARLACEEELKKTFYRGVCALNMEVYSHHHEWYHIENASHKLHLHDGNEW